MIFKYRRIPFVSAGEFSTTTNEDIDLSDEEMVFEFEDKKRIINTLLKREIPDEDEDIPFFE